MTMRKFADHLPAVGMVFLQIVTSANSLLNRASLLEGMSPMVFIVYRQAISASAMFPLCYFTRGQFVTSNMGARTFLLIFLSTIIGVVLKQFLYYQGLYMTSASVASATSNLIPAVTFLFAVVLRLETVDVRRLSSIAKLCGTIVCVAGAVSFTLLKGPKLLNSEEHLWQFPNLVGRLEFSSTDQTWLLGCLALMANVCCWSVWLIMQAATIALFTERNLAAWNLNSPLQLFSCFFLGIVGSGVTFFNQVWCISRKGPFFSSVFTPLANVITTLMACVLLHEQLYLGGLLGSVGVIIGLYIVLWDKAQEAHGKRASKPSK